jgi:hypothetical protein
MKKITLLFLLLTASFSFAQVLSEDFEGGLTVPTGWTNNDIAGGGEIWVVATGPDVIGYNPGTVSHYDFTIAGNYAQFDSDGYGGAGPAENAALESPAFNASTITGNIQLSFSHYFTAGYGGQGFVEVYDGTTWIEVASYAGADQAASSAGLVELDVTTQLTGVTNAQVRFRWVGDYAWGWAVDNVVVDAGPSCLVPSGFAPGTVTSTSFEVLWTDTNPGTPTWEIEWGAEGFTQGTGTSVTGLTSTSYNFMGLTADTTYDFYIRTNCGGAEGDSDWAGPISFATLFDCSTYGLPYNENFDNPSAFTSCFTTEDVDGDTLSWISQQDLDLDGDLVNETFATNASGDSTVPGNKNDWLFSPALSLTGGQEYTLSSSYNVLQGTAMGSLEAFILDAPSSTANVVATLFSNVGFTTQGEFATLETMAYQESDTFTPSTTGDYYIAYRSFGARGSGFVLLFNSTLAESLSVDEFETNSFSYNYDKNVQTLNLESSNVAMTSIEIYSLLGQRVKSSSLSSTSETINVSDLTTGVYLAKVNINGNTKTIKFVKS